MNQPEATRLMPGVAPALRQRVEALALPLARIDCDGTIRPISGFGWLERMLANSAAIKQALRQCWPLFAHESGVCIKLVSGVSVAPLHCRDISADGSGDQALTVLFLVDQRLLECEHLRAMCEATHCDYLATRSRIEQINLLSPDEPVRMAAMVAWMARDADEMARYERELEVMTGELADSYEELSLLYKLSSSMTVNQSPSTFLSDACAELQQVAQLRWLVLQLIDDEPRLEELAGHLFVAGDLAVPWDQLKSIGRELTHFVHEDEQPVLIDKPHAAEVKGVEALGASVLIVPLRVDDKVLGLLYGGDKIDGEELSSVDSKLCGSLANSLSIFLQNMMLYGDVQAMFLGTLHALTSAIDAKDSYTHGHSERVAGLSRSLAQAAGFDHTTCERIYLSGLVHDLGKIGVPESVLCKPGKLSEGEFEQIKLHPEIGARILQDIRQMQDLVPGVMHHHERWDGQGYPTGLAGEAIPVFGRIIGLADAFDAMSSDRTYRQAMQPDQVIREITEGAGHQFDPHLAKLFVRLDFGEYRRLIQRHERRQLRRSA